MIVGVPHEECSPNSMRSALPYSHSPEHFCIMEMNVQAIRI